MSLLSLTAGGMPAVSPATVAHHTIKQENTAIQRMLPINVQAKNVLPENKYNDKFIVNISDLQSPRNSMTYS